MPLPALLLIIATLLPLASFTLLVFLGKRMGNPLSGYVATLAISGSFACSIVATTFWLGHGRYTDPVSGQSIEWGTNANPINLPYRWIPVGDGIKQVHTGFLDIGVFVDSLTIAMFDMVTLVSALVHVFSIGYMREDKRFPRFFTYLGLFCFSMLGLVLGGTLLQLFIFWELVGLCSYLLIGFWYEKKSASNAAMKAFITNRVGDFGFLIGFGILFCYLGNASLPGLWILLGNAGSGHAITLSNGMVFSSTLLTVMGIGLFFGAVGKSAQFPLHVWLPDAMEGPTPVSALIHAATMVAAGVYLVGRIFPILTPDAKLFIATIGCITLVMAALIALCQSDIKKVLAFSTLSQLGYMILAMGIGSWVGGLFHLITHAFFKSLLFLGSGSVIAAAHHEQELPQYGGLIRKIPVTGVTFAIAVLAIAGTPGFSGFYSKDMILAHAGAFATLAHMTGKSSAYALFFWLPAITAYVTAFYMTRCWVLTFWGKPRNQHLYDHAQESPIMWIPLVMLAALSIIAGYDRAPGLGVRDLLDASTKEAATYCGRIEPHFAGFSTAWQSHAPDEEKDLLHGEVAEATAGAQHKESLADYTLSQQAHITGRTMVETYVPIWAFVVGIGLAFLMYMNGYSVAKRLYAVAPLRWLHTWLAHRMYFDELYSAVFVAIVMGLSAFSAWFDKYIVDGLVNLAGLVVKGCATLSGLNDKYIIDGAVNGAADLAQGVGALARTPQTGRIRLYVTLLMVTVALGLAVAIFFALS